MSPLHHCHNGKVEARVRFRDDDGQLRLVQATGDTRTATERALKKKLTRRDSFSAGSRHLSADSTFGGLVEADMLGHTSPKITK
ncbi:MAG: hypothetical protein ACK5LN_11825 [Propioniciclava sp.]